MDVDLRAAIQAEKGHLPPHNLGYMLKINHWAGCQLEEASSINPEGMPLVAYPNEDEYSFSCGNCASRVLLRHEQAHAIEAGRAG
jgi:hypothetical protein